MIIITSSPGLIKAFILCRTFPRLPYLTFRLHYRGLLPILIGMTPSPIQLLHVMNFPRRCVLSVAQSEPFDSCPDAEQAEHLARTALLSTDPKAFVSLVLVA